MGIVEEIIDDVVVEIVNLEKMGDFRQFGRNCSTIWAEGIKRYEIDWNQFSFPPIRKN